MGTTRNGFREEVIAAEDLKVKKGMEGRTGSNEPEEPKIFKDSGNDKVYNILGLVEECHVYTDRGMRLGGQGLYIRGALQIRICIV